jgi:4-diphosphocytidyl-2-C-methyl-D-erythritol kinase
MIGAKAPAKINLFFEVGPKRQDGYHDVVSIYQSLDLFEEVFVEPATDWKITVQGEISEEQRLLVPLDETNLVIKAARALAKQVGIDNPQPMHFTIHKKVPSAGGVAGGSADAAAALVALNEAWCLGLESQQLATVAAQLGADVPFALLGGTALGVDSGVELSKLSDLDNRFVLLVFSYPGLPTGKVFEVFDRLFPKGDLRASANDLQSGFDISLAGRNSLLAPALQLRPDLAELMATVPEGAKLSGSGPTLYLLNSSLDVISDWQRRYQGLGLETLVTRFGTQGAGLI